MFTSTITSRKPTRRSLRTAGVAIAAAAAIGAIAAPASAAPNTFKESPKTWSAAGKTFTGGVVFSTGRMGDSNHYSYAQMKFEPANGNIGFSGHVYNGTVGADNMKTSCELAYNKDGVVYRIPITTANYSIGGHDHKDWDWSPRADNAVRTNFSSIVANGEVTCSLRWT